MHENGSGHGIDVAQWKAHVARAYEAHGQRIAVALTRSFGRWIAEDAVQDAFARALLWRPTAERLESMMDYRFMKRCIARRALRHVRTDSRRNRRERRRSDSARASAAAVQAPDAVLEMKERCELAVKVFGELPSWQMPVVHMIVIGRRTRCDVARITGVRLTTQNNWCHRFVSKLRHRLDPHD